MSSSANITYAYLQDNELQFVPPESFRKEAEIKSLDEYRRLYRYSIENPDAFWAEQSGLIDWHRNWKKVYSGNFAEGEHKWFVGGKLNVSYNCVDRHLNTWRKNKAALIWQGERRDDFRVLTYNDLWNKVSRFANVLKKWGVSKGDRVAIYLPMIPELIIAMLACTRIGAIHNVIFAGFSAESLRERILDSGARLVITADGGIRRGAIVPLKDNVDKALEHCPGVHTCIVVRQAHADIDFWTHRDKWWHIEIKAPDIKTDCPPEPMDSEDPLFILYTSGSTGKPKGVLHTTGGYMVYAATTMKYIFDLKDTDTFWCTADSGWITGHSYVAYAPLALGATVVIYEGLCNYPTPDRYWQIIERFKVNIFYTAPTVIRSLMREKEEWVNKHDLSSLRLLGTVGESINPEAWLWYHRVVGKGRCPIVDTYWQTETGGIIISALPGAISAKPGSAAMPFFGVEPVILDSQGNETSENSEGCLAMKRPWPGLMRGVYGAPNRFFETYMSVFPGYYFTGDGARLDKDGYYWLLGRMDDVINVSGHRIGTSEVEGAITEHSDVAEAAVVGYPHVIKGEGIYAYVILKKGVQESEELKNTIRQCVRRVIGPIATPDKIQFTEQLPKTRSGKIMRRILRKIAAGEFEQIGDITTLADSNVVDELIKHRQP
ncbi:Acetyl-coenzyme A synthetase [Sporomusa carbonis]|uniref:acetate--CoA ligase n=1 Tax=Sporomusa carbonis TaxID=3076075 RepID=UPI003A6B1B23